LKGLEVVPIDINGNGKIDADENFYEDLAAFLEAVNTGKFPSPPARDLYFITKGRPQNPEVLDYFKWVLSDGQKLVYSAGYVPLHHELLEEQIKKVQPSAHYEN
jgi:phosphate transport system substrate-binding protein